MRVPKELETRIPTGAKQAPPRLLCFALILLSVASFLLAAKLWRLPSYRWEDNAGTLLLLWWPTSVAAVLGLVGLAAFAWRRRHLGDGLVRLALALGGLSFVQFVGFLIWRSA